VERDILLGSIRSPGDEEKDNAKAIEKRRRSHPRTITGAYLSNTNEECAIS
jgi:hypothetical protein